MKFSVATMTKDHKIRDIVIRPIKVYMMNFQSTLTFDTYFTMIGKSHKCFPSILTFSFSFVFALVTTVSKFMTFPKIMRKFLCTRFAYTFGEFSGFKRKIAVLRTKNVFNIMRSHFEFFKTFFTGTKTIVISKFIGTSNRTKTSFITICSEYLRTCFASFFHETIIYVCVFWYKNTLTKKEVNLCHQ